MKLRTAATAALAVGTLGIAGPAALADEGSRQAIDTRADYTPFERFAPLATSAACTPVPSGRASQP